MRREEFPKGFFVEEVDPKSVDPTMVFLEDLLAKLSQEERIEYLSNTIAAIQESQDDKAAPLVKALGKAFQPPPVPQDRDKAAQARTSFRRKLRELYSRLPATTLNYRGDKVDALTKLKLAMLEEILQGWHTDGAGEAEVNFRFVCDSFSVAHRGGSLRQGILELFRARFESQHNEAYSRADCLDRWITLDKVSPEIALTLIKARTRIGKIHQLQAELGFLVNFGFQCRSEGAVALIRKQMERVVILEEAASSLARQVYHSDWDDKPPKICHYMPTTTWKIESESRGKLTIVFHGNERDCPKLLAQIQAARDSLLASVIGEPPVHIIIEARGPNEFSYKEG